MRVYSSMDKKSITIVVNTENPETLTRAAEAFGRTAAGLAMEGVPVMMMIQDAEDMGLEDFGKEGQ